MKGALVLLLLGLLKGVISVIVRRGCTRASAYANTSCTACVQLLLCAGWREEQTLCLLRKQ